jgi:hypothetical protein
VAAGGQFDGTAKKGGFEEAAAMYSQGHYVSQVVVQVGGAATKDVELYLHTAFGDILIQTTTIGAAGTTAFFLGDTELSFGPGEYLKVVTSGGTGDLFASIYTTAALKER